MATVPGESLFPVSEPRDSIDEPEAEAIYTLTLEQAEKLKGAFANPHRRPLFIVGSGISLASGVPSMKAVFSYLSRELGGDSQNAGGTATGADSTPENDVKKAQSQPFPSPEPTDTLTLKSCKRLAHALANGPGYRPMAARLFGESQDSSNPTLADTWRRFCVSLLSGELAETRKLTPAPIPYLKTSEAHKTIASLYQPTGAICLSFNFDGLTKKALEFAYPKSKIFILDTAKTIRDFYGRARDTVDSVPLLKIRGDIFYAVCRTSGCPAREVATPLYDLPKGSKPGKDLKSWARQLLSCPECDQQRSLRISFPGLEKKEKEADEILREIWRYIVPTLSSVFIVGLSGVWDERILKSIFQAANTTNIPVYDIKPPAGENDFDTGYLSRIQHVEFPRLDYNRIPTTARAFLGAFAQLASAPREPETSRPRGFTLHDVEFPSDNLWIEPNAKNLSVSIPGREVVLVPRKQRQIANHISREPDVEALASFSQLGLKNYWWGDKSFVDHNRYVHSLGAMVVGSAWHKSLSAHITNYHRS